MGEKEVSILEERIKDLEQLTQDDIDDFADVLWFLKGYKTAFEFKDDNCPFETRHIRSMEKIIIALKKYRYGEESDGKE